MFVLLSQIQLHLHILHGWVYQHQIISSVNLSKNSWTPFQLFVLLFYIFYGNFQRYFHYYSKIFVLFPQIHFYLHILHSCAYQHQIISRTGSFCLKTQTGLALELHKNLALSMKCLVETPYSKNRERTEAKQ